MSGWSNTSLDEITAPSNVPFVPGNNVTGFGSQVPAELTALGFDNAIVFYADDWDPTATTRKVKFRFIAASGDGLQIGYGYALNPSVDQTAFVVISQVFTISSFTDGNITKFLNNTSDAVFEFAEQEVFGLGRWPQFKLRAPGGGIIGGETLAQWFALDTFEALQFESGSGLARIVHYRDGNYLHCPEFFVRDLTWQAFTSLHNGWTGAGSPDVPLIRRMPDGTVRFKGIVFKLAAPAAGQLWGRIPAGYRPDHNIQIFCPSSIAAAPGQKVNIATNGDCTIFDFPGGNGDLKLDAVSYTLPDLP